MNLFGREHQVTFTGTAQKWVRCENCSQEYCYTLSRTSSGSGMAWFSLSKSAARQLAAEAADNALAWELYLGVEVVPCPRCWHVQEHMYSRARELRLAWVWYVIYAILFAAFVGLVGSAVFWQMPEDRFTRHDFANWATATGLLLWLALVLYLARLYYVVAYNPNDESENDRQFVALERATSKAEYLKRFPLEAAQVTSQIAEFDRNAEDTRK